MSRRWAAAAAAAFLVQLMVLYWPRPQVPGGLTGLDLPVHLVVFGAVAYPALRAGFPVPAVLLVLGGHAVVSEMLQHLLVPGRGGDPLDALADLAGIVAAVAIWRTERSFRERADRRTS